MFGAGEGTLLPNLLLDASRIHPRGQNEEEESSFLIWGQGWGGGGGEGREQLFIIKARGVKYSFTYLPLGPGG